MAGGVGPPVSLQVTANQRPLYLVCCHDEQGDRGNPGVNGTDGTQGEPGVRGSRGIKGEKGVPGANGRMGKNVCHTMMYFMNYST